MIIMIIIKVTICHDHHDNHDQGDGYQVEDRGIEGSGEELIANNSLVMLKMVMVITIYMIGYHDYRNHDDCSTCPSPSTRAWSMTIGHAAEKMMMISMIMKMNMTIMIMIIDICQVKEHGCGHEVSNAVEFPCPRLVILGLPSLSLSSSPCSQSYACK